MRVRYSKRKMVDLFANSGDPGQTPRSAASDLGLHCLLITFLGVSRLHCVKVKGIREEVLICWILLRQVDFSQTLSLYTGYSSNQVFFFIIIQEKIRRRIRSDYLYVLLDHCLPSRPNSLCIFAFMTTQILF